MKMNRMSHEYDCILFQMGSQNCQNQNITDEMDNSFQSDNVILMWGGNNQKIG